MGKLKSGKVSGDKKKQTKKHLEEHLAKKQNKTSQIG